MAGINITSCNNGRIENNTIIGDLKISKDSKVKVKNNKFILPWKKRK